MARPKGTRSPDYEARREALLGAIAAHLAAVYPAPVSFREMAAAAGVSLPTLRHYFTNREGLIAAHLEAFGQAGAPYLAAMRVTDLPFEASLHEAARFVLQGFTDPRAGTAQALALTEGLAGAGESYLAHVFEPTREALSQRIALHIARGEMQDADPRLVALMILSPLILGALHQQHLGGAQSHPMALETLAHEVATRIGAAYARPPRS